MKNLELREKRVLGKMLDEEEEEVSLWDYSLPIVRSLNSKGYLYQTSGFNVKPILTQDEKERLKKMTKNQNEIL